MDFFQGQETLTSLEWILRAIVSYVFLLVIAKVIGQRSISQLRLLDFVIALVIGNIIAHPLSDEELGLKGSMITTVALVILYLGSVFTIIRWPAARKLLNASPIELIKDGQINSKGLKKARISIDVLLEELRKEKISDVQQVALSLWEPDGEISVFLDSKYQPITPATYNLATEPFNLPKTIIKEGKIEFHELQQLNKDEGWLINTLKVHHHTEVRNVLLATIDRNNSLKVFLYQ
ncbi:DUF421 domain-containing protein [Neobacillus niacini]|uniref:DUF421 domain-containing protein n=1 Tax=Neobacillus niacini TaxID=86668 RepID=UPI003982DCBA